MPGFRKVPPAFSGAQLRGPGPSAFPDEWDTEEDDNGDVEGDDAGDDYDWFSELLEDEEREFPL